MGPHKISRRYSEQRVIYILNAYCISWRFLAHFYGPRSGFRGFVERLMITVFTLIESDFLQEILPGSVSHVLLFDTPGPWTVLPALIFPTTLFFMCFSTHTDDTVESIQSFQTTVCTGFFYPILLHSPV